MELADKSKSKEQQAHVVEVDAQNFMQEVVERSRQTPVLLDFWAPWCGPCRSLLPILTKLADEFAGKFILAKVNIDEQQELAVHLGVRSVPTVKLIKNGQIVDEFVGALPENGVRDFLDPHVTSEGERLLATIRGYRQAGHYQEALALIASAREHDPKNHALTVELAATLMDLGEADQAKELLTSLPLDQRESTEVAGMMARIEFAEQIKGAPAEGELRQRLAVAPDDSEARYHLALRLVLSERYEEALETLLDLMRSDRGYGDDAARRAMLKLFDLLGGKGTLVARYRSRMFALLH